MGSNVLEFASVSRLTGNPAYREAAEKGLRAVHAANANALLLQSVNRTTAVEVGNERHVSAGTDSYYEYLLKYWLLLGRTDDHWRARWEQAVDEVLKQLVVHPAGWPFSFVSDLDVATGALRPSIHHLRCFFPGNVALGVMTGAVRGAKAARYTELAANMTLACFQLYNQTKTGLGAEQISFDTATGRVTTDVPANYQRPEVIESIFYLWRLTKHPKWRTMGWQMWTAIEQHTRVEGGYSGVLDVNQVPPVLDDVSQSFFFAETLKYFYLLLSPDSALSLDGWVLNTEAHPLRVGQVV